MRLKTISVTYDRKLNLGDFNSLHAAVTLWADLDEHDDEALAVEGLREMARNHVMAEIGRVDQKVQAKVQDLFLGLPVAARKQLDPDDQAPYAFDHEWKE